MDNLNSISSNVVFRRSPGLEDYIMNHDNKSLNALSNLREVYRLSNRFTSTVSLTGTRIHYTDLLLLELFKTKYSVAFSLFEHRWHEILEPDANHQYYRFFQGKDYENHFDFIKYLERHQEKMYLNKFDIDNIKMILSELFMHRNNDRIDRHRINHIKWFNLYINLMQLKSDITENEFNKVMIKPIDEIKKQFSVWLANKSVSLNHRLENYNNNNKLNREQLLKYIQGYIFISSRLIRPRWNSFDVPIEMISHLKSFNNDHEYSEEDRTFILNLLEGSGYSNYISSYVGYLYKEKKYTNISLSEYDLINVQQSIIKAFFNKNKESIYELYRCFSNLLGRDYYYFGRYHRNLDVVYDDEYEASLVTSLRMHVEKKIYDILPEVIIECDNDDNYEIDPFIKTLWESWEKFDMFLSELNIDIDNPTIAEFKEFFKQYKENGYQPVTFDFEHIEVD